MAACQSPEVIQPGAPSSKSSWKPSQAITLTMAVSLVVPYMRFRDTHLAHHRDSRLTDPYDDPESNFLDPDRWAGLSAPHRAMLRVNNTLAGRMVIGPLLGQIQFMAGDMRAIWAGDRRVALGWLWHIPAVAIVVWVFAHVALMPLWAFVVASYVGVSLLKIRTFLEHRAHVDARARTVVIEDRGFLAFLFLNNNFHSVHHMYPCVPWYRLPGLYAGRRTEFLTRNEGYRYGSYRQIFGRYLWAAKDPVPHPLWSRKR